MLEFQVGQTDGKGYRTKSKIISDSHKLYRFLANPCIKFAKMILASDDVVWALLRCMATEEILSLRPINEVKCPY